MGQSQANHIWVENGLQISLTVIILELDLLANLHILGKVLRAVDQVILEAVIDVCDFFVKAKPEILLSNAIDRFDKRLHIYRKSKWLMLKSKTYHLGYS